MHKLVLPALAFGVLLATAPVTATRAAPVGTMPIAAPEMTVETVRHTRAHRMQQRRMMKRRMMKRRGYRARMYRGSRMYAPSQAGNARDPHRPVSQQSQGQTTGGPRY